MKLRTYLSEHSLTLTEFAEAAGLQVATVSRVAAGKVTPSRDTMVAIYRATGGVVGPADFYDLPTSANTHEETAA